MDLPRVGAHLGDEPVHIVGASIEAAVALKYLVHDPSSPS